MTTSLTQGSSTGLRSLPAKARVWAYWDGTVMEQRGRNGWQTFGSLAAVKRLDQGPFMVLSDSEGDR
jgi:hypothetical protein